MNISFKHKQRINMSPLAEAMILVRALADGDTKQNRNVTGLFSSRLETHSSLFDSLRESPLAVSGFLELMLLIDERKDPSVFFGDMEKISREEQLFYVFGHHFSLGDIERYTADPLRFGREIEKSSPLLTAGSYRFFSDFERIKKEYADLIFSISTDPLFGKLLEESRDDLERKCIEINGILEDRHPLSYAQERMGKSFRNIADWTEYEIIPSLFASPGTFRLMDSDKQILVTALDSGETGSDVNPVRLSENLKILGDPRRMEILRMTYMKPMYGKQIAEALNLTTATVSHHLDCLHKAGLLNMEQDRQIKYFSVNLNIIESLLGDMGRYIKS